MRNFFYILAVATLLAFVSCDNEPAIARDDAPRGTARSSSLRTIDEAIDIANSSASFFFGEDVSRGGVSRRADNVKVIRGRQSRSTGSDTLLYIVNYADSAGFAVIAANKAIDPLFAVTETGSYDGEPTGCPGFDMYICAAKEYSTYYRDSFPLLPPGPTDLPDNPEGPGWNQLDTTGLITVKPGGGDGNDPQPNPGGTPYQTRESDQVTWIVNQPAKINNRWRQRVPWGNYCINHTVGCGPLAAAFVMSYYEKPTHFSGSRYEEYRYDYSLKSGVSQGAELHDFTVDWSIVKLFDVVEGNEVKQYQGLYYSQITDMMARVGRHIGFIARADYKFAKEEKDYTTGVTMPHLREALCHYGFACTSVTDYKGSALECIGEAIAIISGSTSDSGHAWILDGVKRYSTVHTVYYREKDTDQWQVMSRSSDLMHYNHFNWGWGTKCVGWFNDNVFRGDRYSTLDDSSDLPTEDDGKTVKPQKDYCKNVKFFIVRD